MKKLKIMIAAILAASLTVSAAGCKPSVATQKETLGSTTTSAPVAVAKDEPTTSSETTTVTEATTTTVETTTEATTTEASPVLVGQGSDVLADMRVFNVSEFTDTAVKMNASMGESSAYIDMVKKTDGDISYEYINDIDFKLKNTQDATGTGFFNSMSFSMKDIETYTSGDAQYMSEKGLCSMMESMTQMLIQMFAGLGESFTNDDDPDSGIKSDDVQKKLDEALDMLHKAIQDFVGNSQDRYIKVTKEDLMTAMSGMTIDTSSVIPQLDFDPAAFADAFEPVKADFCSSDGEYNVFSVNGDNKDLFFDTILELDDEALKKVMTFLSLGDSTFNTSMSIGAMSDSTSGTADAMREKVNKLKENTTSGYRYAIRTTTNADGYMTMEISTNSIMSQTIDEDTASVDTEMDIAITGGTLTNSISLPSEDNVISFTEWYKSFNEATASAMQSINGGSAE